MNIHKTENFKEILSAIKISKQKAYASVNATLVAVVSKYDTELIPKKLL